MKNLKIFSKTFICIMSLMLLITLTAHLLLYFFMPKFYVQIKKNNLLIRMNTLVSELENSKKDTIMNTILNYKDVIHVLLDDGINIYELIGTGEYTTEFSVTSGIEQDNQNTYGVSVFTNSLPEYSFFSDSSNVDSLNIAVESDTSNTFSENRTIVKVKESLFSDYINKNEDSKLNTVDIVSTSIVITKSFRDIENKKYVLLVYETLQPVDEARSVILVIMPFTIIICSFISTIFALIYSKTITNPIKKISSTTQQMKQLDKTAKCNINSNDEIGILADNLNNLYNNLINTIESLKLEISHVSEVEQSKVDFMRTASHELKTPITAISGMLEGMIHNVGRYKDHQKYLYECKSLIDNLSLLIKEILDTSKLDMFAESHNTELVELSELIESIIEPYRLIANSKHINLNIDSTDSFKAHIHKKLFSNALSNVISNAVNYTEQNNNVYIFFENKKLIIENECTPISKEDLEHIFEPFYRPDFSRSRDTGGNGLGLYMTEKILSICNIEYEFIPMKNSRGMKFIVYL